MRIKKELYRGFAIFLLTFYVLSVCLGLSGYKQYAINSNVRVFMILLFYVVLCRFRQLERVEAYSNPGDSEKVSLELYRAILRGDNDRGKG